MSAFEEAVKDIIRLETETKELRSENHALRIRLANTERKKTALRSCLAAVNKKKAELEERLAGAQQKDWAAIQSYCAKDAKALARFEDAMYKSAVHERCEALYCENESLKAQLAAAQNTGHEISEKAIDKGAKLYRDNDALRTRLAAADSLIAELKQREADRLSAVLPHAFIDESISKKYEHAARERDALKQDRTVIIRQRDDLIADLELALVQLESKSSELSRIVRAHDALLMDINHHYTEVFGAPKSASDEFFRAAVARLAQYAKAGYRLNNAMAEVETATRQYESLSGPHAFTVDIVAEITERVGRRVADETPPLKPWEL